MKRAKDYRQYLMIASAMLLSINFCTCSSDINEDTEEELVPMAFGANVSESTQSRAIIDDLAGLQSIGFSVYGYKQRSSETTYTQIFSNQSVTWNTDDTDDNKWTYSPLKYWDRSSGMNYYFTAYAPHVSTETSTTAIYASSVDANHSITINNLPQWQSADASDSYDLIVADKSGSSSSTTDFPDGIVKFDFHHKLALLEIKAMAGTFTYKITSITIGGDDTDANGAAVPDEKRSYTHKYDNPAADDANKFSAWTSYTSGVSLYSNNTNPSLISTSAISLCKWLVVPFTVTKVIPIKITYYKTDSSGNRVGDDITTDYLSTGFQKFESDYKYTITLGITADEVKIKTWTETESEYEVWNW